MTTMPLEREQLRPTRRPQLVALPTLLPAHPGEEDPGDDDARFWLTAAGAVVVAGIDHVSFTPCLDEIVSWDDAQQRWDRIR